MSCPTKPPRCPQRPAQTVVALLLLCLTSWAVPSTAEALTWDDVLSWTLDAPPATPFGPLPGNDPVPLGITPEPFRVGFIRVDRGRRHSIVGIVDLATGRRSSHLFDLGCLAQMAIERDAQENGKSLSASSALWQAEWLLSGAYSLRTLAAEGRLRFEFRWRRPDGTTGLLTIDMALDGPCSRVLADSATAVVTSDVPGGLEPIGPTAGGLPSSVATPSFWAPASPAWLLAPTSGEWVSDPSLGAAVEPTAGCLPLQGDASLPLGTTDAFWCP